MDPIVQALLWKVLVPMVVAPLATLFVKWVAKKIGVDLGGGAAGASAALGAGTAVAVSAMTGDAVGVVTNAIAGAAGGLAGSKVRDVAVGKTRSVTPEEAVKNGLSIE